VFGIALLWALFFSRSLVQIVDLYRFFLQIDVTAIMCLEKV
tara:strand:+ start:20077 stop:20199 length:123 start_codon:yes stop_codon:yes gene_type:complete